MLSRPATTADAAAIHDLVTASQRHHAGSAITARDAVDADLNRTTLDRAADTRLVYEGDVLIGWAWVHRASRAHVVVHPEHEGRGLGTELLLWTEQRARDSGSSDLGQTVDDANTSALRPLATHGYQPKVSQWQLEIALPAPARGDIPGISFREFRAGDEHAAYEVAEDAFATWQPRRRTYAEWAGLTIERDTFSPTASALACDGPRIVGLALSLDRPGEPGCIERVAVHPDYRRRGIAQALLSEAFAAFARAGKRSCELYTHSRTGALTVYQRAGMTVGHSATHVRRTVG